MVYPEDFYGSSSYPTESSKYSIYAVYNDYNGNVSSASNVLSVSTPLPLAAPLRSGNRQIRPPAMSR